MKILIAADGNTLDDRISKQFGNAAWFLIVDVETLEVSASRNLNPQDHHEIVPRAGEQGVTIIVAGNIGPRSYDLISSVNMKVALARNMSVLEAIDKLKRTELKILDAPRLRHSLEERELLRRGRRGQYVKGGKRGRRGGGFTASTPRGRHHVQQYSGRGH